MPKQKKLVGYALFLQDYKKREERLGRKFKDMADVADDVAKCDAWKSLTQEKRDEYKQRAKGANKLKGTGTAEKYNCLGIPFSQLEKEMEVGNEEDKTMKAVICNLFNRMLNTDALRKETFYIVHVNYFCNTKNDGYIPAEIAIAKFNILHGYISHYHALISPELIPIGYRGDAKEHADVTHKLPVYHEVGTKDLRRVYRDICKYIMDEFTQRIAILYTMPDNEAKNTSTSAVKGFLTRLKDQYGRADDDDFVIYSLPYLFCKLRNRIAEVIGEDRTPFPQLSIAQMALEQDRFAHTNGIACEWHDSKDWLAYCSVSHVIRYIFMICDICCETVGINRTLGKHVAPEGGKTMEHVLFEPHSKEIRSDSPQNEYGFVDQRNDTQGDWSRSDSPLERKQCVGRGAPHNSLPSEKHCPQPLCYPSVASVIAVKQRKFQTKDFPQLGRGTQSSPPPSKWGSQSFTSTRSQFNTKSYSSNNRSSPAPSEGSQSFTSARSQFSAEPFPYEPSDFPPIQFGRGRGYGRPNSALAPSFAKMNLKDK